MRTEKVVFESEGQKISGILHLPEKQKPLCVIASHGLLSSKDSEKYIALGEKFSQEGMAMLRFDFRGIGESEGRMEDDTVSRRVIDLGAAIAFVRSHPALGKKIGFIGSSLGGYISLIRASMDQQIKGIVTWATPFHLDDLQSNKGTEGHPLPEQPFFEDLPKHRLLPLLPRVANCMVIHGEKDELVPVDQAWEIFQNLSPPKEIHIIEGADHRLTQTAHRERAIQLTVDWFKKAK